MNVDEIVHALACGRVVGLPTETVFGLAVSLSSEAGVEKLMRMKEREVDSGKVFTLVPESVEAMSNYVMVPEKVKSVIAERVPGALTAILPKNPDFAHFYFDHFEKIGVRIPDFPLFIELLPKTGPLLLTSANRRGEEPARTTGELRGMMPEVDFIFNSPPGGLPPSEVVDFTVDPPRILRR